MTRRIQVTLASVALALIGLSMVRPIDHDESQYVAATVLTAHGLLPYRDYAYLQTPLQPFLLAPVAWLAGGWVWPVLRLINAAFGGVAMIAVAGAARTAGASARMSVIAALLFASCDILLFSTGTARNDALPAACLSLALWLTVRPDRTRMGAAAIGLLLAAATAAKLSYAVPALAYGAYAVWQWQRERPVWVAMGVAPVAAFVGWTAWLAPHAFWFGVYGFPTLAPADYYLGRAQPWKLGTLAKAIDFLKFLALGPALPALVRVARAPRAARAPRLLALLIGAGIIAALLPTPTWRQYLLPLLPPLFVAFAMLWTRRPPGRRERMLVAVFVVAGLAPTVAAMASGGGMIEAMRQSHAIRAALLRSRAQGPVATLSPQFIAGSGWAIDPRFATGPFYVRSRGLLTASDERAYRLVSRGRVARMPLPPTILTGGEGRWTSGDDRLDALLAARARQAGYRAIAVPGGRFTLWRAR